MFAAALCLVIAQQPITFEPGLHSLETIVQKLADQTGEKLEVQGSIKTRVYGIFARSETPEQIKENLAKLNHATWQLENGKLVLRQTPEQVEEEKKLSEERFAQRFQKIIDSLPGTKPVSESEAEDYIKKIRSKRPDPNGSDVKNDFFELLRAPVGGNVAGEVAKVLGPTAFKFQGPSRVVFALKPNKMQKPMDAKILSALSTFLKNQELLAKYAEKYPIGESNISYGGEVFNSTKALNHVLVSIANTSPRTYSVSVKGYSDTGALIFDKSTYVSFSFGITDRIAENSKYNVPVELSEESISGLKLFADRQKILQAFDKYIKEPANGDLLTLVNYDALKFWANKAEKSLYAAVPDSMVIAPFLIQDRNSLLAYQSAYAEVTEKEEDDKRILLMDAFPIYNDMDRYPREILKQYYIEVINAKTLDQKAKVVYDYYEYVNNTLWQVLFTYSTVLMNRTYNPPENMAFFGGLSAEQKNKLINGQPIQYGELNKKTQGILHDIVFKRDYSPIMLENASIFDSAEAVQRQSEYINGIGREVTELLPNGFNIPISLNAFVEKRESYFGNLGGFYDGMRPLSPYDISSHANSQHILSGGAEWRPPENITYYKGLAVNWTIQIFFDKVGRIVLGFDDHSIDMSQSYSKSDMPKEFWDEVYKLIEQQKAYQTTQSGGGSVKP